MKAQRRGDEGCCDRETNDASSLFFPHNRSVIDDLDHCCFAALFIGMEKFDCISPNVFPATRFFTYVLHLLNTFAAAAIWDLSL